MSMKYDFCVEELAVLHVLIHEYVVDDTDIRDAGSTLLSRTKPKTVLIV